MSQQFLQSKKHGLFDSFLWIVFGNVHLSFTFKFGNAGVEMYIPENTVCLSAEYAKAFVSYLNVFFFTRNIRWSQ